MVVLLLITRLQIAVCSPSSSSLAAAAHPSLESLLRQPYIATTMSSCGNCDCADKTNCTKKGNSYGIEVVQTEKSYESMEMTTGGENDGKCKCGPNCTCTTCTCGH